MLTASQGGNANYDPAADRNATVQVNKATLTAAAQNASKAYLAALPNLTYALTGFVHDENASVLATSPSIATTAPAASAAGSYPLTVSGGSAANYDLAYQNGSLVIGAGAQSINFVSELNATYGVAPLTLEGNATSGLSVSYASSNPLVAEVNGSK